MRSKSQGRPVLRNEGMWYLTRQGEMGALCRLVALYKQYFSIEKSLVAHSNRAIVARTFGRHNIFLINNF